MISTPAADADIAAAFAYIHERSPLNAERSLRGLYASIDSLERFPNRCGAAPEAELLGLPLRQFIYHSHRLIFIVSKSARTVHVLGVRHGARLPLADLDAD